MTPTSKPVATPEMVEKARLWWREYCTIAPPEQADLLHFAAEFAASAVQDAVREIVRGLEARAKAIETSAKPNPFADLEFHAVAASLREKYGVTP